MIVALLLVAGLAPNGAFMYQMPQGLVYAAPPMNMADGTASAHQNFMLASSGESNGQSGQQQQFITIPVPMSLTQQVRTVIPTFSKYSIPYYNVLTDDRFAATGQYVFGRNGQKNATNRKRR